MTTATDAARSDAPTDRSANDHCTFCMLAEFDIDRGSTLSYQYPAPSGYDEHMLAELMLPDGVHARTEDWTFFFLKPPGTQRPALRDAAAADDDRSSQSHASASATASGSQDPSSWLSDDLAYVINLVRTKHDNTVRRGAMVKAMAIGTRHPFIDVFKPALLLALDDYFQDPGPDCLARLYDSINRLDLSSAPTFSRAEKLVLRASDRRDLFEERFVATPRTDAPASNQPASAPAQIEEVETARSTPSNAEAPDSVRPRTNSTSTLSSETKSIKKKLSVSSLRPSIGARRGSSANSIAGVSSIPDKRIASSTAISAYRPRDTHFFDTTLVYRSVPLPIRVPLTTFPEEVGEYSLIRLIQTFSGPQSTPSGPVHPHLHINGPSTHPIIVLFNALVTQKRVIFLGYGQPAHLVASFVLAACALGSGCGAVLQGFAARAFPYTNLLALDELETVPGYIAGVTNPRFEDLHAWDLLLNVETGRIQVAKDIAPAPTPTNAPSHAMQRSATLPREAAGSNSAFGSVSSATGTDLKTSADADLAQFGALPTNGTGGIGSSIGNGPISNKASSMSGASARDRSNTAQYDTRSDSSNTLFMEELQSAIAAHYGERYIRSRVQEYVFHFVQRVARHEEHFCGRTWLGPACQPFLNGQLGSGPVYADRDSEMREILSNQMRIEGFRRTIAYQLLADKVREFGGWTPAIRSFDLAHQLGRLRRARKLHVGESDLIFQTIAQGVVTHDQIVEVLALLPPHTGGLLPIAMGLFHPVQAVRDAVVDFLLRLCQHPVGRKFVQSMHTYQRLAFARLAQERAEADVRSAQAEVQELTVAMTGLSAQTEGSVEVRSPTALSSNGSGPRGDSYQSFSPTKETASTSATALAEQNAPA